MHVLSTKQAGQSVGATAHSAATGPHIRKNVLEENGLRILNNMDVCRMSCLASSREITWLADRCRQYFELNREINKRLNKASKATNSCYRACIICNATKTEKSEKPNNEVPRRRDETSAMMRDLTQHAERTFVEL